MTPKRNVEDVYTLRPWTWSIHSISFGFLYGFMVLSSVSFGSSTISIPTFSFISVKLKLVDHRNTWIIMKHKVLLVIIFNTYMSIIYFKPNKVLYTDTFHCLDSINTYYLYAMFVSDNLFNTVLWIHIVIPFARWRWTQTICKKWATSTCSA